MESKERKVREYGSSSKRSIFQRAAIEETERRSGRNRQVCLDRGKEEKEFQQGKGRIKESQK